MKTSVSSGVHYCTYIYNSKIYIIYLHEYMWMYICVHTWCTHTVSVHQSIISALHPGRRTGCNPRCLVALGCMRSRCSSTVGSRRPLPAVAAVVVAVAPAVAAVLAGCMESTVRTYNS